MNSFLFKVYGVAALVAIPMIVALNLAHPFFHSFEGGQLDLMLPYLDAFAVSVGGERVVNWSRRRSHRSHDSECPFQQGACSE